MWRHKCSPALLLSRCFPVQPRSGQWRRSSLPQAVWQRVKLLVRCWHIDASRQASPGWCTGRFPGLTAQTLWVHAAPTAVRTLFFLFCFFVSSHHLLHVYLYSFTGSVIQGSNERGRNHPQWTPEEIRWDVNLIVYSLIVFCIRYALLFFWIIPILILRWP